MVGNFFFYTLSTSHSLLTSKSTAGKSPGSLIGTMPYVMHFLHLAAFRIMTFFHHLLLCVLMNFLGWFWQGISVLPLLRCWFISPGEDFFSHYLFKYTFLLLQQFLLFENIVSWDSLITPIGFFFHYFILLSFCSCDEIILSVLSSGSLILSSAWLILLFNLLFEYCTFVMRWTFSKVEWSHDLVYEAA